MAVPKILVFKNTDIEDYLAAAIETAEWIKKYEVVTEEGKRWKISGAEERKYDEVEDSFLSDRSLYSGAAGIGFFFIQLYEVTKEKQWLDEAIGAADYLIHTYSQELSTNPGIHTGTAGEGLFLELLYKKTGEQRYRDQVIRIADDIYEKAIKEDGSIHWQGFFDYMGDGGAIAYWLHVAEAAKEQKYVTYAKEALDSILKLQVEQKDGSVYWKLFDPHEYFKTVPEGGVVPNFAHGTAGIAYLLTKYYEITRDEAYLTQAEKGIAFLKSIAINQEDASIVPYIYLEDEKKPYDILYLGYCHGPVGDGITLKELYRATGKKEYLDFYERLTNALIKAGVPEKRSAGYWNDCICCGSSGALLHFIDGSKIADREKYLQYAKRTANKLVNDAYKDGDGRRWYNAWTRIKPWDVDSHIGLFVGAAGSASALLSLYGELKGIAVSALYEYTD